MQQHVREDLSAYLDGALAPADRALVRDHLAACAACRAAAAELSATARLIAALPRPDPSRRLVPSLETRFAWLRPVRSLSAVLAGVFVLVFMASATLDTGWRMGGGRAGGSAQTTSSREAGPAAAPQATALERGSVPAPAASPTIALQEQGRSTAFASPAATGSGARAEGAPAEDAVRAAPEPPRIGPSPWLWLGLAAVSGILALVAHRRLRAV